MAQTLQSLIQWHTGREPNTPTLVAGAGGFIGGHLVASLLAEGRSVRAVDIKPLSRWYQRFDAAHNICADLSRRAACEASVAGMAEVFNLAADMGGMGFIETHKTECMLSVLINTNLLLAASNAGVSRYFFSSSACVYAADKQVSSELVALREEDAYPAMPEDGYGWEKLFGERLCRHFREDTGIVTRVARYHNVYGPNGTFQGERAKAPAAICRKVIEAKQSGDLHIEIWGDGHQTRSFMFIDDCIAGSRLLMDSGVEQPINIGSSEMVSIDSLVSMAADIAGVRLQRHYNLDAPKGVRGRNSDNTRIRELLDWEPSTSLRDGLEQTYRWIHDQIVGQSRSAYLAAAD